MRAFRAIDDPETCYKFAEGHRMVLESYGIKQITSSRIDWIHNPGVYVIVVESVEKDKVIGGTRIHVANGVQPLPMEDGLKTIDPGVPRLVEKYEKDGTGELCGLWTIRESTGLGLSVLLTDAGVAEAGIALARQLELKTLFVLCAPWTVGMARNAGFVVEESVGMQGTFPYPRPDLLATLLIIKDNETLESAKPEERERIYDLRRNPKQTKVEAGPKGKIEIQYDLFVQSESQWNARP